VGATLVPFATARSAMPSRLKSATATDVGTRPAGKGVKGEKRASKQRSSMISTCKGPIRRLKRAGKCVRNIVMLLPEPGFKEAGARRRPTCANLPIQSIRKYDAQNDRRP
jgi:hypothetical protein